MEIPSNLYSKYDEAMSLFFSEFGIECTYVYVSYATTSTFVDPVKKKLTMSPSGGAGVSRPGETTKLIENTETATLRVYKDRKQFNKLGAFNIPEGGCITIGNSGDFSKMRKASYILIESEKFERVSDPQKWGLNANYCVCGWKKV